WALYEKGVRYSSVRPAFRGAAAFIRKFFLKGGMLQGADGFTVTLTTVIRAYMKYQKLNEMYEEKGMK
ncbi:MAG: glycosyltransferase family 2 protein, partial [Deltaproteobacteria bacterium]|nr:glycosyltransferase family 2 protein [Deltaproteobacteria bacterium]